MTGSQVPQVPLTGQWLDIYQGAEQVPPYLESTRPKPLGLAQNNERKTTMAKTKLQGPYRFVDNTDYQHGWELETQADVLRFFERNDYLLDWESWGNAYDCGLTDSNGERCWVFRGPRGGLRVSAEDPS